MTAAIKPVFLSPDVTELLEQCGLPVSDCSTPASPLFFGHRSDSQLVGVVGLEDCGSVALLRSLGVAPSHRMSGLGQALVLFAEGYACSHNISSVFLLTTTAAAFFAKLGYVPVSRGTAPASIQATAQFSSLCPSSATFMVKVLASNPALKRDCAKSGAAP